jgi:hypothetical protein
MRRPWDDVLALGRPPNEERLAHVEDLPARPPSPVPFPDDLDPRLWSALVGGGITELYSHQREVWDRSRTGAHVGVVTGTASGKTLAYALPVIAALLEDPHARALYLSPTRRSPRTRRAPCGRCTWAATCGRRCTTATPTSPPARWRGGTRTCCSRTPTCSTSASAPTPIAGATCSRTSPTS